jgi:hypothetical protein
MNTAAASRTGMRASSLLGMKRRKTSAKMASCMLFLFGIDSLGMKTKTAKCAAVLFFLYAASFPARAQERFERPSGGVMRPVYKNSEGRTPLHALGLRRIIPLSGNAGMSSS